MLTLTFTDFPFLRFVTFILVPNGSVLWAAVFFFWLNFSPLAVFFPWKESAYKEAKPFSWILGEQEISKTGNAIQKRNPGLKTFIIELKKQEKRVHKTAMKPICIMNKKNISKFVFDPIKKVIQTPKGIANFFIIKYYLCPLIKKNY